MGLLDKLAKGIEGTVAMLSVPQVDSQFLQRAAGKEQGNLLSKTFTQALKAVFQFKAEDIEGFEGGFDARQFAYYVAYSAKHVTNRNYAPSPFFVHALMTHHHKLLQVAKRGDRFVFTAQAQVQGNVVITELMQASKSDDITVVAGLVQDEQS